MVCTQPRRIAAITLCHRVGYEMGIENGRHVAYQVRYDKTRTPFTKILFATEGVILRHLSVDPLLKKYKLLVLDEVHERRLFTDFLLGMVKVVVAKRPDLRVVLMSATINGTMFTGFFPNAPIISVLGRQHVVQTVYRPIGGCDAPVSSGNAVQPFDAQPFVNIISEIDRQYHISTVPGDVLIFLYGADPIEKVVSAIAAYGANRGNTWLVLPLHGGLKLEEQEEVFQPTPEGQRKCVVATNIAETSITINGIRFVIDSGIANVRFYDHDLKMYALRQVSISKASADQRRGRAGRTMDGMCYRLYGEHDYAAMSQFEEPEIRRTLPDELLLQMLNVGIELTCFPKENFSSYHAARSSFIPQQPRQQQMRLRTNLYAISTTFEFLESPAANEMEEALACLIDCGAVNILRVATNMRGGSSSSAAVLTSLGRLLAALPLEMRSAKLLTYGALFQGCTTTIRDACMIAAGALACSRPLFTKQAFRNQSVSSGLSGFVCGDGDFASLMEIYDQWASVKASEDHYNDGEVDDGATLLNLAVERFLYMGPREMVQSKSRDWCAARCVWESYLYDICQARREYNKTIISTHLFDARFDFFHTQQFEWQRLANDADGMQGQLAIKHKLRRILNRLKRRRAITMAEQCDVQHGAGDARFLNAVRQTITSSKSPELAAILASRLKIHTFNMEDDDEDDDVVKAFEHEWAKFDEQDIEFHLSKMKNVCVKLRPSEDERQLLQLFIAMALYPNIGIAEPSDPNECITLRHGVTRIDSRSMLYTRPIIIDLDYSSAADFYDDGNAVVERFVYYYKDAVAARPSARYPDRRPFLRMCGRVPALQALLMCCNEIDISNSCSRIIFDRWFEVVISDVLEESAYAFLTRPNIIDDYDADAEDSVAPAAQIHKRKAEFLVRFIRVRKLLSHAIELVACAGLGEQTQSTTESTYSTGSLTRAERMTISENIIQHVKGELCKLMKLKPCFCSVYQKDLSNEFAQVNMSKYTAHPSLHAEKNGLVIDDIFSFDTILADHVFGNGTGRGASQTPATECLQAQCFGCSQTFNNAFALFRHCRSCCAGIDGVNNLPFMLYDAAKPYRVNPWARGGNDYGQEFNDVSGHLLLAAPDRNAHRLDEEYHEEDYRYDDDEHDVGLFGSRDAMDDETWRDCNYSD